MWVLKDLVIKFWCNYTNLLAHTHSFIDKQTGLNFKTVNSLFYFLNTKNL